MKTYKYYAFISYKREDEKWAKWLQHRLEYFHLPLNVRKQNPDLPKKVRPIFKDTTDLSGGILEKAINDALESSRYLIVICSPLAAQSPWVYKEVQRFIDLGKAEYIIPFIVGGTPHSSDPRTECFPESLKALEGSRELLGININENGRESAVVKVVARMFDIQFDTLWQRYRKARRLRMGIGIAVISLLALIFAFFSFWIYHKNEQLAAQNEIILRERNGMLISQSRAVSEKANQLIETGDPQTARALAMRVLPPGRPYVAEAELVLRKTFMRNDSLVYIPLSKLRGENGLPGAVSVNAHGTKVAFADNAGFWLHDVTTGNEMLLEADDIMDIHFTGFTADDCQLVGVSIYNMYFWDIATGKLQKNILLSDLDMEIYYMDVSVREYLGKIGVQMPTVPSLAKFQGSLTLTNAQDHVDLTDPRTGMPIARYNFQANSWNDSIFYAVNPGYKEILFSGDDKALLYDHTRQKVVQTFNPLYNDIVFSEDGNLLVASGQIYKRQDAEADIQERYTFSPYNEERRKTHAVKVGEFSFLPTLEGSQKQQAAGRTVALCEGYFLIYAGDKVKGTPLMSIPLQGYDKETFYAPVSYGFLTNNKLLLVHPDYTVSCYDLQMRCLSLEMTHHRSKSIYSLTACDYDPSSQTLFLTDQNFVHTWHMNTGQVDSTLVIPTYTIGNGQEYVADVKCIDENRLLVLVEQGNHRVVNRTTGKVMFLLEHGYWLAGMGREPNLSHAESYIAEIKYIKSLDQLYTLSSGGVLRIYDMLSGRMLQCIPLPENAPEPGHTSITYSEINPDGTTVKYAFRDENVIYEYRVNILQELMDSVRTKTEKRVFSEIEKNEYYLFD